MPVKPDISGKQEFPDVKRGCNNIFENLHDSIALEGVWKSAERAKEIVFQTLRGRTIHLEDAPTKLGGRRDTDDKTFEPINVSSQNSSKK